MSVEEVRVYAEMMEGRTTCLRWARSTSNSNTTATGTKPCQICERLTERCRRHLLHDGSVLQMMTTLITGTYKHTRIYQSLFKSTSHPRIWRQELFRYLLGKIVCVFLSLLHIEYQTMHLTSKWGHLGWSSQLLKTV